MMSECVIDQNDPFYATIYNAPMLSVAPKGSQSGEPQNNSGNNFIQVN